MCQFVFCIEIRNVQGFEKKKQNFDIHFSKTKMKKGQCGLKKNGFKKQIYAQFATNKTS